MGAGSYWVRKDDQTGEARTIKPWEETVSNGDKSFPDPHGQETPEEDAPRQEQGRPSPPNSEVPQTSGADARR